MMMMMRMMMMTMMMMMLMMMVCRPFQDVTLHHVIRQDGKPYAEEINAAYKALFTQVRSHPAKTEIAAFERLLNKWMAGHFHSDIEDFEELFDMWRTGQENEGRSDLEKLFETWTAKPDNGNKSIAEFEKLFNVWKHDPTNENVSNKLLRHYQKLLFVASVEELSHCDVVLCTCAVGGNRRLIKGVKGTVFQVIRSVSDHSFPEPEL
jgi:hypothetical protein